MNLPQRSASVLVRTDSHVQHRKSSTPKTQAKQPLQEEEDEEEDDENNIYASSEESMSSEGEETDEDVPDLVKIPETKEFSVYLDEIADEVLEQKK